MKKVFKPESISVESFALLCTTHDRKVAAIFRERSYIVLQLFLVELIKL